MWRGRRAGLPPTPRRGSTRRRAVGTPAVQILRRGRGRPPPGRAGAGQLPVSGVCVPKRKRRKRYRAGPLRELFFRSFRKWRRYVERGLAPGRRAHFVHGHCSALAQASVQTVQLGAQNFREQVMATGAATEWRCGGHADHDGVISGQQQALTLGLRRRRLARPRRRSRKGRTAASQASPTLRYALVEHCGVFPDDTASEPVPGHGIGTRCPSFET